MRILVNFLEWCGLNMRLINNSHSNILISVALVNSGKGSLLYAPGAHSALQRKKSPS